VAVEDMEYPLGNSSDHLWIIFADNNLDALKVKVRNQTDHLKARRFRYGTDFNVVG